MELVGDHERTAIAEAAHVADGSRWPSFFVYDPADPTSPDVVFEGATELPAHSADAMWAALQHWCKLLTNVRRALADATWQVNVDDVDIPWDENTGFDPAVAQG